LLANAHWPPAAKRAATWMDWLLAGAIVVYLLANTPFLVAWPAVNGDEGRELNAFWVASGIDPSARTLDPIFQHDPLYKGGLQGLSTAVSFRVLGFGLFQGRVVSLIWGGLLLWFTFLAGRRLYGAGAASVAVLIVAVSQPFLVSSHIIRPDIVVAALVMAALYCALRGLQDGGRAWHLIAGLILGLSFDVHPNTIAFMPMVGLCYLLRLGRRAFTSAEAWLFLGGIAIGALYYLGARVLPDPRHYLEAFGYWVGVDKRPPALATQPYAALQAELWRWNQYFSGRIVELGLLSIGALAVAWRMVRTRRLDPLFIGLLLAFGVFVVLVSSKTEYYLILFFPLLALLLGSVIGEVGANLGGARLVAAALLVVLAVSAMGFEDNFRDVIEAASDFQERDYAALSAQLRREIPPGSKVVAPPVYWIGLAHPPYYLEYVDFYVWERIRRERNMSWSDFMRDIDPDYVVLDVKAKYDVTRDNPRYLENNADLVTQIKHVKYDRVEVWRLRTAASWTEPFFR
jgi:4-amino-4-deoxy-L-arabinose transferase-like glycosyltransferase